MRTGRCSEGARRRDYYSGAHRRRPRPGAHRRGRNQPADKAGRDKAGRGKPSRGGLAGVLAATLLVGGAVAVPQLLPISGSNTDADGTGGGVRATSGLAGPAGQLPSAAPSALPAAAAGAPAGATAGAVEPTATGLSSRPPDDVPAAGALLAAVDPAGPGDVATDDCPHVVVDESSLTVRAVDRNDEIPGYDALSVTGRVGGDHVGVTAFVALWDPTGLPVTMARTPLPVSGTAVTASSPTAPAVPVPVPTVPTALKAPTASSPSTSAAEWTLARLDGAAIGSAGASGVFTVEVVLLTDVPGCPFSPPLRAATPLLTAGDFAG